MENIIDSIGFDNVDHEVLLEGLLNEGNTVCNRLEHLAPPERSLSPEMLQFHTF